MAHKICFQCFKRKDGQEVCPHCGYAEHDGVRQAYQLVPGTVLRKRYVTGVSIGIGGFGITYKAFDVTLGMIVAVKEFYPAGLVNRGGGERKVGIFSGEKELEFQKQLERFLQEARNMALFSKERDIVNVFDYFEDNQTAYIIMEYVEAPLLKDMLKKRRFSVEEASGYMFALLDALEKVHRHSIIHKDISPDNIFLTGEDTIKLFDFGAARLQGTERTEAVVVKAGYTPPEQYTSEDVQDFTTDIYAAGAVFYEMVTGEKPMDSRDRVMRDEIKRLKECGVQADEYLERIIFKAMALEPGLRFQNTRQFKSALASRKKVRIPQEEIIRNRRIRRVLTAGLLVVILVTGTIVGLNLTVFSGRGRIDVRQVKETDLSVWLSVKDTSASEELTGKLRESVATVCPQLTVEARLIPEQEYAKELRQALEQDNLPDVFCTDGIAGTDESSGEDAGTGEDRSAALDDSWYERHCTELSRLLRTMNLSGYLYLEELAQEGDVYTLPAAIQIAVLYISDAKQPEAASAQENSLQEHTGQGADIRQLAGQQEILGYADTGDVFSRFQDPQDPLCQIAGDLSTLDRVEAVTVEAVPSTDFTAVALTKEEKLAGVFRHHYAVKKSGDKDRQDAAMVLLSLLFSEGMQSALYMDNGEGLPLNRAVLEIYKENKLTTYLNFLKNYDLGDVELSGENSVSGMIRNALKE